MILQGTLNLINTEYRNGRTLRTTHHLASWLILNFEHTTLPGMKHTNAQYTPQRNDIFLDTMYGALHVTTI